MASSASMKKRQRIRKGLLLTAFLFFPITIYYFSPALIVQAAAQGVVNGSFLVFGLLFLSGLVLGRSWCAWACPGGGLGEACQMAGSGKAPGGKLDLIKYLIWVPWLGIIVWMAVNAGGYHTIDPFYQTWHGISLHDATSYIVYFSFVALIALLSWWPGRRGFCHYVCWMAPFMVLAMKLQRLGGWPTLHLRVDSKGCVNCGTCLGNCPMSLDVPMMVASGDMFNTECILCRTCVDNCERNVIHYAWGRVKKQ